MKDTKRVDFWTGIALIALSAGVWALTADLPTVKRGIGPGDYPRVIAVLIFILGAVLAITNSIHGYPKAGEKFEWKTFLRTVLLAVMAFVYVSLLDVVGFPLLTPFFLFAKIKLFGYKNNLVAAIVSAGTTAVVFLLFNVVFQVFLPYGLLG